MNNSHLVMVFQSQPLMLSPVLDGGILPSSNTTKSYPPVVQCNTFFGKRLTFIFWMICLRVIWRQNSSQFTGVIHSEAQVKPSRIPMIRQSWYHRIQESTSVETHTVSSTDTKWTFHIVNWFKSPSFLQVNPLFLWAIFHGYVSHYQRVQTWTWKRLYGYRMTVVPLVRWTYDAPFFLAINAPSVHHLRDVIDASETLAISMETCQWDPVCEWLTVC